MHGSCPLTHEDSMCVKGLDIAGHGCLASACTSDALADAHFCAAQSAGDKVEGAADKTEGALKDAAGTIKSKAGDAKDFVKDKAGDVKDAAKDLIGKG